MARHNPQSPGSTLHIGGRLRLSFSASPSGICHWPCDRNATSASPQLKEPAETHSLAGDEADEFTNTFLHGVLCIFGYLCVSRKRLLHDPRDIGDGQEPILQFDDGMTQSEDGLSKMPCVLHTCSLLAAPALSSLSLIFFLSQTVAAASDTQIGERVTCTGAW